MSVRRIGVLTSGGDAPGMNPCVRAVVRTALYHGLECYGIRRGWNGLISGDIVRLDEKSVAHTINRGGTILYTARSEEFMTEAGQRKAVSTCKFLGLDSIIAIGGDGTFRGALALSKYGINVIGIPGTIDNDISCTNYCIGFDTAANTAIECIDTLPCMWAWPAVQPPFWSPRSLLILKRTSLRKSVRPGSTASPTI